jgi:predicted Zn-dependent protease
MDAANVINKRPLMDRQSPRPLLLRGLIYWRMELIAYCSNDKARISRYGGLAISTLDEAEKNGADPYIAASHRALACQLIAGLGIGKGTTYGPREAKELEKARKANPRGYFSLLATAINTSQAPSFVGGSPEKAVVMLEKMENDFPDSIDVKIHLAAAYRRAKRREDAFALIQPIVKAFPANLLAQRVLAETMRR